MRILFITYDFPFPTNSGGKTRAYNLLRFAKKDAEVTLLSFVRRNFKDEHKQELLNLGISEVITFPRRSLTDFRNIPSFILSQSFFQSLYYQRDIETKILEIVASKKIDIVHFESFYTGYYLSKKLQAIGVKQVFGTENIEYLLYEAYASHSRSFGLTHFFAQQARKIRSEEERFYTLADCVLAVTEGEGKYIRKHMAAKVVVIENGVSVSGFAVPKKRPENTILFLGNFSYFPNVDAMRYFMQDIFPLLHKEIKLVVVGKKSTTMRFLQDVRVTTKEFVEDINEIYNAGTIFVSPVRIGGGTNFKILEAMAAKLPVVALADRVVSFDFKAGEEILVADSAVEFAEKIHLLLDDRKLQMSLAENAYKKVKKEYDWTRIGANLYNTWKSLVNETA